MLVSALAISMISVGIALLALLSDYGIAPETANDGFYADSDGSGNDILASGRIVGSVEPQSRLQLQTATPVPDTVLNQIEAFDQLLINLYDRVNPSVVNIEVSGRVGGGSFSGGGSGFVLDMEGHIATNSHVVQDAQEIYVTFFDGYVAPATVVGRDDYSDLAVIKVEVEAERLVPVVLGDSREIEIGQRVVAIGNPFGLQNSMTFGIVSATGRVLPSAGLLDSEEADVRFNNPSIIQIDATINPGNSGGPVLNLRGEVVGIATAIRTESGTFEGVAFAVPVNTFKRVAPQLIEDGGAEYSWLGIESSGLFSVTELADPFDLPVDSGVLIGRVFSNSPADDAGLRGGSREAEYRGFGVIIGGDIITSIDATPVHTLDELLGYLVENTSPGDTVTLTVIRGNQTIEVPITLEARPSR